MDLVEGWQLAHSPLVNPGYNNAYGLSNHDSHLHTFGDLQMSQRLSELCHIKCTCKPSAGHGLVDRSLWTKPNPLGGSEWEENVVEWDFDALVSHSRKRPRNEVAFWKQDDVDHLVYCKDTLAHHTSASGKQ